MDPPHYDFWNGTTERKVIDTTTTHDYREIPLSPAGKWYGFQRNKGPFLDIVPPGTGVVVLDVTWHAQDPAPTKLGFQYSTAATKPDRLTTEWHYPVPTVDEASHRKYVFDVHPLDADSPYANQTGWDFTFFIESFGMAPTNPYGKFTGSIDWKVTAYRSGYEPV